MKVLSLFDGMSCGRLALSVAGINVSRYSASEINKHAMIVSKRRWPDISHIGNVVDVRADKISFTPDLIIAGSPCQGFSFAGNRLNLDDPRSKLFWEFNRILKEVRKSNQDVKFLLENVCMDKRSECVISDALGVQPMLINSALVSAQNRERLYWTNIGDYEIDLTGMRIPLIPMPEDTGVFLRNIVESRTGYKKYTKIECSREGNCIVVGKANGEKYESRARVYSLDGKSPTLTCIGTGGGKSPKIAVNDEEYITLNVSECERLQCLPVGYTEGVSNTQRYNMIGNGWNIATVAHIFKYLKETP